MTFLNAVLLWGLFAVAIPPIVHLLNRRRFRVVDWAAMQFLNVGRKTRQKVLFEQIFLMLLRAGLIVVLVLAVASPLLKLNWIVKLPYGQRLAHAAGQTNRDIVLIVDGSYSMDYKWQNQTAHDSAKDWAGDFLKDLNPGDRVAILQAKQQPAIVLGSLTADLNEARAKLERMPRPRGGVEWEKTVQQAFRILEAGNNPRKEIVILTDGQRYGWADPKALAYWQSLADWSAQGALTPRIWVVNVAPDRPDDAPNWLVSPIAANRTVATIGREVRFKFDLQSSLPGRENPSARPDPPKKVLFSVDEEPAGERALPRANEPAIGMSFKRSFGTTGSHLVTVVIDEDAMPGDNRADFAIDVLPAIPVLIVDGDRAGSTYPRGSDFIRYAVAPARDPRPSFYVQTISIQEFASTSLNNPVAREPWTVPRVLILQNVPSLTEVQHKAIEEFLERGGGVLAALGPRCVADSWNLGGYRDGQGWLPARMLVVGGDETDGKKDLYPIAESVEKTFLDLFKQTEPDSFLKSSFGRWWKVALDAAGAGNVVAALSNRDPLFVEKPFGKGRVLLAAVPLDDSWRSNFLHSHDFVRLCHESLYYLAGTRFADVNLEPGQEIYFRPNDGEPPGGATIRLPTGEQQRIDVAAWPLVYGNTRETGVYKLTTDSGRVQYYVVQPDGRESNLTACTEEDRRAVASFFPDNRFVYETDRKRILQAMRQSDNDPELGGLFLLLAIGLLAVEVVFTRALVKKNPPVMD